MSIARIVSLSAIMLAATVFSGCAAGTSRLRRESAEPLPGRLIESDAPSVVAPGDRVPGPALGGRSSRSPAPGSVATRPQLVTEAVPTAAALEHTRRRWFQGWTWSPREIAHNMRAGFQGPSATADAAGRRQAASMVRQTQAVVDASTLPVVPTADAPKSPVVRASRLTSKPMERLPVSIALELAPRTDDDDRLASHEEPIPDREVEPTPDPVADANRTEPPPIDEPTALVEEHSAPASTTGFPAPVPPPDLDDLDAILERTGNGETLPTVAQEVPPEADLDQRFPGRPRLSTLPNSSGTTTLTMKGQGARPVGLPARLPEPTYPEDRSRYGTMTGRTTANLEPRQPQAQPSDPTTRRRGLLSGLADAIGGRLMGRETGHVAESR